MLVFKKTFDNTNNPAFIYEKFDSKSFIKSCKISIQQLYSLLLRACQFDVYIYIYIYSCIDVMEEILYLVRSLYVVNQTTNKLNPKEHDYVTHELICMTFSLALGPLFERFITPKLLKNKISGTIYYNT